MSCAFNKYRDFMMIFVSILVILSLFLLFIFSLVVKLPFGVSYNGIVEIGDDSYVVLYVSDNEIAEINNKKLFLKGKRLDYKIIGIDDDYTLTASGPLKRVCLSLSIDDSDKINNNVLKLIFVDRKTIFERISEVF